MDADHFDRLTRIMTDTRSRRGALAALLGGPLGLLGLSDTTARKSKKRKRANAEGKGKKGKKGKKGRGQGKANKKLDENPPAPLQANPAPPPPPPICTPNCASKTCGDDGCGGSCGACRGNQHGGIAETCQDGTCVCPSGTQDCPFSNYCAQCCSNADCCGGAVPCPVSSKTCENVTCACRDGTTERPDGTCGCASGKEFCNGACVAPCGAGLQRTPGCGCCREYGSECRDYFLNGIECCTGTCRVGDIFGNHYCH